MYLVYSLEAVFHSTFYRQRRDLGKDSRNAGHGAALRKLECCTPRRLTYGHGAAAKAQSDWQLFWAQGGRQRPITARLGRRAKGRWPSNVAAQGPHANFTPDHLFPSARRFCPPDSSVLCDCELLPATPL